MAEVTKSTPASRRKIPISICRIRRCKGVCSGRTGSGAGSALVCASAKVSLIAGCSTTTGQGGNGRPYVEQVDERRDVARDGQQADRRGEHQVCHQAEPEDPEPGRLGQLVRGGEG